MNHATCRFCDYWRGEMVRYSIRHHAHLECALPRQGMKFLRKTIRHPGLRWKVAAYSIEGLIALLPAAERTLAVHQELVALLGRSE